MASSSTHQKKLNRYLVLLAGVSFLVIIMGGLVTSTETGLSVPDWPLSFGQFFPAMNSDIIFEHSHRVVAGTVGLLTLVLFIWLLLKEKAGWLKALGGLALLMVITQAILGGLTVLYQLPTTVSVLHACLAQAFFTLICGMALVTSKGWREKTTVLLEAAKSIRGLCAATTFFVSAQLVLGAIVRHTHGQLVAIHILIAFLIVFHIVLISIKTLRQPVVHGPFLKGIQGLCFLVLLQFFLGIGAFIAIFFVPTTASGAPPPGEVLLATGHQAIGALILAGSFLMTLMAYRHLKPS